MLGYPLAVKLVLDWMRLVAESLASLFAGSAVGADPVDFQSLQREFYLSAETNFASV